MESLAIVASLVGTAVSMKGQMDAAAATEQAAVNQAAAQTAQAEYDYKVGVARNEAAKAEAVQMDQNAGSERAAAQIAMREKRRESRLALSRAQAQAAASGASVLEPGVNDILSGLDTAGDWNAAIALYEGETQAQQLETQARFRRYEGEVDLYTGDVARRTGTASAASTRQIGKMNASSLRTQAVGTAISGVASLYDKYGKAVAT